MDPKSFLKNEAVKLNDDWLLPLDFQASSI
jgi:hypothetical protein